MSRRIDRVNVLLRQEISRVLTAELSDPRLASVISITHVDASSDLHNAKVFVSVLGDLSAKRSSLKALKSAAGFIHRSIRRNLVLKAVPTLHFLLDESIERGAELLQLMEQVEAPPEGRPAE